MTDRADIHERTRRTLSREFDEPGASSKDSVKRARAHLGRCPQCRAFDAGLTSGAASGATVPEERAGEVLVSRILAAVEAERVAAAAGAGAVEAVDAASAAGQRAAAASEGAATSERAAVPPALAEPTATEGAPDAPASHRAARRWRAAPWLPRFALGITAAAAVVALFVGARAMADRGLLGGLSAERSATSGTAAGNADTLAGTAAPQGAPDAADQSLGRSSVAPGASASGSAKSLPATPSAEPMTAPVPAVITPPLGLGAPSGFAAPVTPLIGQPVFITFRSDARERPVWRFSGWLRNTPSNILVKVGTVNARLGAGGRPVARTVYERLGDSTEKFVWWADDDYQVYRPVTMRLAGTTTTYALVSAGAVPDWGFWPAWPQSVAPYPRDRAIPGAQLVNEAGAVVYRAGSTPPSAGFAVSPSSKADPVAHIPKWTWYSATAPVR